MNISFTSSKKNTSSFVLTNLNDIWKSILTDNIYFFKMNKSFFTFPAQQQGAPIPAFRQIYNFIIYIFCNSQNISEVIDIYNSFAFILKMEKLQLEVFKWNKLSKIVLLLFTQILLLLLKYSVNLENDCIHNHTIY